MPSKEGSHRGVTLVELVVVITVIAVLAGILVPVFTHARDSAKLNTCVSNLAHISMASKMYYDDQGGPPLSDLPVALADYVDSPKVFVCPADARGATDSYSAFYVGRVGATGDQYLVGCPRHAHGKRTAIAFAKSNTEANRNCAVSWNGQPIRPGDTITGGVITFSDGSKVTVQDGVEVGVLASFGTHGTTYSMIFVPDGSQGSVDCKVTPGSMFEVVTPAAIAGVQGTSFRVWWWKQQATDQNIAYDATQVAVTEGAVVLGNRFNQGRQKLAAGRSGLVHNPARIHPPHPEKKPKKPKNK